MLKDCEYCHNEFWSTHGIAQKCCSRKHGAALRHKGLKRKKPMNFSFRELYPIFIKAAKSIKYKYRNQYDYEIDELVNEAWIRGGAGRAKTLNLALRYARQDMIIYVWSIFGQPRKKNGKYRQNPYKFKVVRPLSLGAKLRDDGRSELTAKSSDEIKYILKEAPLSRSEKLVLNLKYLGGFNTDEIARVVGYSLCYISIIHKRALQILRKAS